MRLGEQLQVARLVDQARAHEQQVVVVRREALEEPQQLRVVLARCSRSVRTLAGFSRLTFQVWKYS